MKAYYPALDGLRAVAVAVVLLAHAGLPFLRSGAVGVDVFFVLSGFLITGILAQEIHATGQLSWRNFYARRLLRLAPCLVVTTALFSVLYLAKYGRFPGEIVAISLTYTANWARALYDGDLSVMGHCWSLAIEEQYYLVWPAVVWLLERRLPASRQKFAALAGLAAALALYRNALVGSHDASRIYFGLDTHSDGLVLGSSLAYLGPAIAESGREFPGSLRFLSRALVPLAVSGLLLLMHLASWVHPLMGRFGFFLVAGAAGVIIADLVLSPFSILRPVLSAAPLVNLGRISYGLYLLHYPIFDYADFVAYGKNVPFLLPLKLLLALAAATACYHLVEKPFLRRKNRFSASAARPGGDPCPGLTPATALRP